MAALRKHPILRGYSDSELADLFLRGLVVRDDEFVYPRAQGAAVPTSVYFTGFEHGAQLVAGVGNGLAVALDSAANCFVEAGAAHSGGFGLRMTEASFRIQFFNPNSNVVVGSFFWRAVSKPASNDTQILILEQAGAWTGMKYDPATNKIKATVGGAETQTNSTITTNQWYLIEFRADISTATWTLDWKIDGVDQPQITLGGQVTTNVYNRFDFDCDSTGQACTWNFDDLNVSVTTGDYPMGPVDVRGWTASQTAAAEHQGIVTTELQTTTDWTIFDDFLSATETVSRALIDDLNTTDGIRMAGAQTALTLPTFRAAGAKSAGTTSAVTVSAPAGITAGDLEMLVGEVTNGQTLSITNNGGGAWTALTGSPQVVAGGRTLYVWWRLRVSGDGDPQVTASGDQVCAARLAFTAGNFDRTTPFEVISFSTETTSDTSYSFAPGNSTSKNNCLGVTISTILRDSNTASVPVCTNASLASLTSRANYCTSNGAGGGFGVSTGTKATAGTMGTWACTYLAASPKAYVSFAIRPAIVGGGALAGNCRWPTANPTGVNPMVPFAVSLITASRQAAAGTSDATFRTLVGASTTNHFTGAPAWGVTWNYLRSIMTAKPGGGVWTLADVNAIRFECDSTDCNPAIWLSGFYYEVAFLPDKPAQPTVVPPYPVIRAATR